MLRRAGVTITEIVVVLSIILVLASLSFYAFTSAKRFGDRLENDVNVARANLNRLAEKSAPAAAIRLGAVTGAHRRDRGRANSTSARAPLQANANK